MAVVTKHDRNELAALAPGRRTVYLFLSNAFSKPPEPGSLCVLQEEAFADAATHLFGPTAISPLVEYAREAVDSPATQEELRREFMNVFKIPGPQYVTPYESVFRDGREVEGQVVRGLLMGPSAVDVQRWYRLAAVDVSDVYKDLPDHIALQLNFLAHLCGKEDEFIADNDETHLQRAWEMERDFLMAHVVSWIPALRDRIHEKCQHRYLRAVADSAVRFTRRDLATLESVVGPACPEPGFAREKVAG
jgi:TorA maturation chaperone TorD